jgi:hypothetical protein
MVSVGKEAGREEGSERDNGTTKKQEDKNGYGKKGAF